MPNSHPSPLIAFVNRLQARSPLLRADCEAVASLPHTIRKVRRLEYIIKQGEAARFCCVLISGFAVRQKITRNGARQIFSIHSPGDAVDLQNSMLGRADHDVQMLSNGEAAFIPVQALRELVSTNALVCLAMWLETLVDSAIFREWTLNIGRRDARARLAHMLCEFAVRLEAANIETSAHYELPMTQEELSDALALTPIHVSRTLKTLVDEGLVKRSQRAVTILDWHRLAKLGEFDAGYLHLTKKE